jgi:hypothetical protein
MIPERMLQFRKASLYCFIGFLCLTALFAIYAVLIGEFGDFEVKVLMTTTVIAVCSVACMCCAAYAQKLRRHFFPVSGIVLAVLAGVLLIIGIWADIRNDPYWKITASLSTFAVACAHFSILSLPALRETHRWVQRAAGVVIFLLALLIVFVILEEESTELIEEIMEKSIAVMGVLLALVTLTIPILYRMAAAETSRGREKLVLSRRENGTYGSSDGKVFEVREIEVPETE